jgi:integration host factor subunit alpha
MSTFNKAMLIKQVMRVTRIERHDAQVLVEAFFENIRVSLARGEVVKLSGFGNFILRDKAERPGRNPRTGAFVPISKRRVVLFHPGQKLKERIEVLG